MSGYPEPHLAAQAPESGPGQRALGEVVSGEGGDDYNVADSGQHDTGRRAGGGSGDDARAGMMHYTTLPEPMLVALALVCTRLRCLMTQLIIS